mgnify:FL=1
MAKFFKWMLISILVLISLPILLVGFILVGMGIATIREELKEKNQPSQSITEKVYSDGRKTIRSFGARKEFAILRFSLDKNEQTTFKKARLSLYDRDNSKSLERDIEKYKEISPCLYVIGNKKGYTKLNYETDEVIQSENINDFSEEDKEIFKAFD